MTDGPILIIDPPPMETRADVLAWLKKLEGMAARYSGRQRAIDQIAGEIAAARALLTRKDFAE